MWLGPVVKVPAYIAAWAMTPEVVKDSLPYRNHHSNDAAARCIVTPKPLATLLGEIAEAAHWPSRAIFMDIVAVREAEEGPERTLLRNMSHRNAGSISAILSFRGEEGLPYRRGRTCMVTQRQRIQRMLGSAVTNAQLAELYTPAVIEIKFGLRRDVANGARGLQSHECEWMSTLLRLVAPRESVNDLVRANQRVASSVTRSDSLYAYTASRFLSNVEASTLARSAEALQPAGLTLQMRPYQRKTLHFCLNRETVAEETEDVFLWRRVHDTLWYSPVVQRFSTCEASPSNCLRGGIVAEEMGMGKTLEMLALMLTNPAPTEWNGGNTIVVCPVALVSQWAEEARRCLETPGRVYVYHGSSRRRCTSATPST